MFDRLIQSNGLTFIRWSVNYGMFPWSHVHLKHQTGQTTLCGKVIPVAPIQQWGNQIPTKTGLCLHCQKKAGFSVFTRLELD